MDAPLVRALARSAPRTHSAADWSCPEVLSVPSPSADKQTSGTAAIDWLNQAGVLRVLRAHRPAHSIGCDRATACERSCRPCASKLAPLLHVTCRRARGRRAGGVSWRDDRDWRERVNPYRMLHPDGLPLIPGRPATLQLACCLAACDCRVRVRQRHRVLCALS